MIATKHIGTLFCCLVLAWPPAAFAWGAAGHRIIGVGAVQLLGSEAHQAVVEILGDDAADSIGIACFWPDTVRKTPAWEWSAPLHYVNIPRDSTGYDGTRDCPNGLCVTEGIKKYARELAGGHPEPERRWQAFAWLCHLVGDLHQPLHAAYRDDRGGNRVEVEFRDRSYNLHEFWDHVLVDERLGRGDSPEPPLTGDAAGHGPVPSDWMEAEVNAWTDESHALAARYAYPPARKIDDDFAAQCWSVTGEQWRKASIRLARILNTTLGTAPVRKDEP